jgi:hypothetical protein
MRITKYIALIILGTVVLGCDKMDDFRLTETIFIEDPYAPGLPVYSEWGYNTFGAYIDRKVFISTSYDLPAKIIVNGDILHLILRGRMGSEDVDLKFSIKGYSPATNLDLTELDDTVINLKGTGHSVTLKIGKETSVLQLIEGDLMIKKVQRLYVDEELSRTIMSGYFNFKTFFGDEPVAISFGRFDLGIGYENFYNY